MKFGQSGTGKVYGPKDFHEFGKPVGWWNRFKQWVAFKWAGKRWFMGYDFGNEDHTVAVFGYIDRKGVFHIEDTVELDADGLAKALKKMGLSFREVAKAFGGLGKAFNEAEQQEKEISDICKPMTGKPFETTGAPMHERLGRCITTPIEKDKESGE